MKIADFQENYGYGYFLVYNSLIRHSLVGFKKPFRKSEAWLWLLSEACRKKNGRTVDRDFGTGERTIFEPYGCITHSLRFIANAWGWSVQKTDTYLKKLEKFKMLHRNSVQQITQIEIYNFYTYQNHKYSKQDSNETAMRQQQDSNETNSNTITRKYDNTDKYVVSKKPKQRSKSWKNSKEEMDRKEFVNKLRIDKRRHINLIAEYADQIEYEAFTKGQWHNFMQRNLKPAQNLAPFDDEQISSAFEQMQKDLKSNGGFIDKWTLETLFKYVVK